MRDDDLRASGKYSGSLLSVGVKLMNLGVS